MFGEHSKGESDDKGRPILRDTLSNSPQSTPSRTTATRRVRLATLAAAVVVTVGAAATAWVLSSGNDGSGNVTAADAPPTSPAGSLITMTRADGSTYAFTDFAVTCDNTSEGVQELVVQSPLISKDGESLDEPYLRISVQMDKLQLQRAYPLPVTEKESAQRPISVFISDAGPADGHNEASGAQPSAKGKMTFDAAVCGDRPSVDVQVSGELGSEVKEGNIAVEGRVSKP